MTDALEVVREIWPHLEIAEERFTSPGYYGFTGVFSPQDAVHDDFLVRLVQRARTEVESATELTGMEVEDEIARRVAGALALLHGVAEAN